MRRFLLAISMVVLVACQRAPTPAPVIGEALRANSQFPDAQSVACAKCHPKVFDEWMASQHAQANRLMLPKNSGLDPATDDAAAFSPPHIVKHGSFETRMWPSGRDYIISESFSNGPPKRHNVEAVIGITPLRQFLVTGHGGRLQTAVMSFDPRSNEWFNAQGTENRQPHEWGFWTNRSMTWNVQCAFCHMTELKKNYIVSNDTYRTSWTAMGIACAQCHPVSGTFKPVSDERDRKNCPACVAPAMSTNQMVDACASCHARREQMTENFRAGDRFDDHFRLTLPDAQTIYYADGQIRDEDFEYGSFRLSRMGHKGVACLDCHNPHTGKLKLPATNNALCLQCHLPPGQRGAIAIDFVNHGHHSMTNAGWLCVDCHMPQTKYMVRDPRRDHGFTSPDPQLTIDLGIPNACNACHTNDAKWANDWTVKWYGEKMNRPSRRRAYAITQAWNGDSAAQTNLLALAKIEEVTAWRATLDSLLAPWATRADVRAHLIAEATNGDPLVRSAVLRALGGHPPVQTILPQMLADTSRLVRIDAAWATFGMAQFPLAMIDETQSYLDFVCDQPAGALRRAEFALNLGRTVEAETWARKAAEWDPSAAPMHALGRILHAVGKTDEALGLMQRASKLAPDDVGFHYDLALLCGELGRSADTVAQLKECVRIDPLFGRAWYNLGLVHAASEKLDDAVAALKKAETLMPESPEPAFARATIHLRQNKKTEARAAAEAALKIEPDHQQARHLINQL